LNADLKTTIGAKAAVRAKPKLQAAAEDHMKTVGTSPERVYAYFHDPNVR